MILADISEFQELDAGRYIAAGYTTLIVRAHNGNRPDHKWPARQDYVRGFPFAAVGYYQYLVAGRPSVDQARELIATVGPIRPNEFVIVDSEEGAGDQTGRIQAWVDVVDAHYGQPSTVYASESWFADKLSGVGHWAGRPRWIAAYRSTEPTVPHELWQYTDAGTFPGISGGADGNAFHGTALEFAATFAGSSPAPPPPPRRMTA